MSLDVCENYAMFFLMVCFCVGILGAKSKLGYYSLSGWTGGWFLKKGELNEFRGYGWLIAPSVTTYQ